MIIKIPIRELHGDLIKHPLEDGFYGARSESGDVIIGDILLWNFMPPQLKMSNCHKLMCGFEICIFSYIIQCELNVFRSRDIVKLRSFFGISHSRRSSQ